MALCKNRLQRKGGKFITEEICHDIALWSGWRIDKERAGKENSVTVGEAIVNKEMARERRWRAWFIRSFKGVMWQPVGNWLSLKEPSRDTESGRQQWSVYMCLWAGSTPNTSTHTLFGSTCSYTSTFWAPVKHFISPLGKTTIIAPHHINSCVPLPLKELKVPLLPLR